MDKNRRAFIKYLSVAAAAGAYFKYAGFNTAVSSSAMSSDDFLARNISARLADLARANNQEFGVCVRPEMLGEGSPYIQMLKRDCSILVAEAHMKWKLLNPSRGEYIFSKADKIVNFAQNNAMKTRFHALVWHRSMPEWLVKALRDGENPEKLIRDYADVVLTRYRGKMRSWDIVNEPIIAEDKNPKGMRSTPWYAAMGDDYVAKCFRIAKEYELGGDLVLNETWLSVDKKSSHQQRQYLLDMVRDLKDRDVPIDAVGLQSHLKTHMKLADFDEYTTWLENLKETGVKILITELDINDREISASPIERARVNAEYARDYLERIYSVITPEEILVWGINDRHNWLNNWQVPPGAHWSRPTLYTKDDQKNPLHDVMAEFLAR